MSGDEPIDGGYILISRSIMKSSVFVNEKWLKVWLWCLLKASHEDMTLPAKTGRGTGAVTIKRGQFIFGRNAAARELNMKPSTVRNIVHKLATWQNLDIKEDSHYSIVTIRNYKKYQNPENYKRTGKRTTKGQAKDTYNKLNTLKKKRNADRKADPRVKSLLDYWHNLILQENNFAPETNGKTAGFLKAKLCKGLSEDELKECMRFYVHSEKYSTHGASLTAALSDHSLTLYRETVRSVRQPENMIETIRRQMS